MVGFSLVLFIMFAALAGTSYYIAHRLFQGLSVFLPHLPFPPVLLFFVVMAAAMALGFGRSMLPFPKELKHILGFLSGHYMGIFVYLLLFTALADAVLLAAKLLPIPTHSLRPIAALCILLLTAVTYIGGYLHAENIKHVSYTIPLENKADVSDMNIVMISDLHLGAISSERRLENVVAEINSLNPDLVCISGDFFDTDFASIQDPASALQTLRGIRSTFGVYACTGNHDSGKTASQMTDFLEQANIHLLQDMSVTIDDRLLLVGRLDPSPIGGFNGKTRKPISDIFIPQDSTLPVITLDHNPSSIDEYATETDLILCGHTHRGQIFPGNLMTKPMFTVDYGYYQKDADSPHVVVSSGVGCWGMPIRVGTDCEIVSIRLTSKSE